MKSAKLLSLSLVISLMVSCALKLSSTSLYLAGDGWDRISGMLVTEGGSNRTALGRIG